MAGYTEFLSLEQSYRRARSDLTGSDVVLNKQRDPCNRKDYVGQARRRLYRFGDRSRFLRLLRLSPICSPRVIGTRWIASGRRTLPTKHHSESLL